MSFMYYKKFFSLFIYVCALNGSYFNQKNYLTNVTVPILIDNNKTNDCIQPYRPNNHNYIDRNHNNDKDTIIIGFLGEYSQMRITLGALPMAVETVNRDPTLLPGKKLSYKAFDIGEESDTESQSETKTYRIKPIRYMTQLRDEYNVAAFIGPGETCSAEALLASAWNIPMLSFKCSDTIVSNKEIFHTFGRTLPPPSKISKSVVSLLRAFHWYKFAIIFSKKPIWGRSVAQAIQVQAHFVDFSVTHFKELPDYRPVENNLNVIQKIVDDTFVTTRIYVFIGEHITMMEFVRCMQNRHLLQHGDYFIISVDNEVYDSKTPINLRERIYLDPYIWNDKSKFLDDYSLRSLIKISMSQPQNPHMRELCNRIKHYERKNPLWVPFYQHLFNNISVPIYGLHLYDSVMIYAKAITNILNIGGNIYDGRLVMNQIFNHSYHSVQDFDVHIDSNGDAEGNYTVIMLYSNTKNSTNSSNYNNTLKMSIQPIGYFVYNQSTALPEFRYIKSDNQIQWIKGYAPLAEPLCGFYGELCPKHKLNWRYLIIGSFFGFILIVAAIFFIKYNRHEQTLANLLWKIDMKDVTIINIHNDADAKNSKISETIYQICRQSIMAGTETNKRAFINIGLYHGNIVAMKKIHKKSVDITRAIRKELKQMREIHHENIINFIGISIDYGNIMIFTSYCSRGSLEDVLFNDDLQLDHMFISSLVNDILRGLIYLHDSDIISHGNLRSSNCLVDSRWLCQITDFGLHEFKAGQKELNKELKLKRELWKAPELLRDPNHLPRGTQKGDVYSFGIVLYEIIGKKGPWGEINHTPEEIIHLVKQYNSEKIFRPSLDQLDIPDFIRSCLLLCWQEDPELRPDIHLVQMKLKQLQEGLKPNIFDNMLTIMEKYAYNLESLIQERTYHLYEEKKKTDLLLHQMLPTNVAELLKRGERVEPEYFDCVTILFSDIVSFTELCSTSTPVQVIEMLNDLYTCCDSIISHYDVYKVETIGDAYMVVSGLPIRNGQRHVSEIASLALHLLQNVANLKIHHKPNESLQLRIGIHTGPCAAGVVGLKRPRYCLFGDTVNTASRMESNGEAMRVHISEYTYQLLENSGGFQCLERGFINVKGKGVMRTYWLISQLNNNRTTTTITTEATTTINKTSISTSTSVAISSTITDMHKKFTSTDLLTQTSSSNNMEKVDSNSLALPFETLMDTKKNCEYNNTNTINIDKDQQGQIANYINRNSYCNCATKCLYNRYSDSGLTQTDKLLQSYHNNHNHHNHDNTNNKYVNTMCNENHLCVCRLQSNQLTHFKQQTIKQQQKGPHSEPIIAFHL